MAEVKRELKTGDRVGRLKIVDVFLREAGRNRLSFARVECDCGTTKDVRLRALVEGTVSCGCLSAEKASSRLKKQNANRFLGKPLPDGCMLTIVGEKYWSRGVSLGCIRSGANANAARRLTFY